MDKKTIEERDVMFGGDELAISVWQGKYATEGETHYDQMHRRLAKEFARIEINYIETEDDMNLPKLNSLSTYGLNRKPLTEELIYELFQDFKYIVPQGRVMAGLGVNESYRSLSNCLRLPSPSDSYSSIMYSDTMLVSAAKRGCGFGLGISKLRPEETPVQNAASSSTGAVSFMERFSNSTREVGQNSRRGACLIDIDVRHPDIEKFIDIKKDLTKVTGANISIFLNDEFMKAVENDEEYVLRFPCNMSVEGDLAYYKIDGEIFERDRLSLNELYHITSERSFKIILAKELWDKIIKSAKDNAEPGVFFRDRMTDYSPSNVYEKYFEDGTNACGEQPMAIFDSCRLMVLNLFSFVKHPFTNKAEVDYDLLYKMSYEQLRLTDDLVDLEIEYLDRIINKIISDPEPIEEKQIELTLWRNVREMAVDGRRTGCGITALGDMLAALNLKYDSDEALKIVDEVMYTKMKAELDCTIDLSILRGSFEGWSYEKEYIDASKAGLDIIGRNSFYEEVLINFPEQFSRMSYYGRRNVNFNTIAPCGSVSLLTQSTSGCEPLFMPFYMRRKKINPSDKEVRVDFIDQNGDSWQEFPVLHPKFKEWMLANGNDPDNLVGPSEVKSNILNTLFKESPWYGSIANDIDWKKRVEMQAVLQKYTSSAISTTLNLPETVTYEEVSDIYMQSWKMGLKGQTIYVENSRTGVMVSNDKKDVSEFEYHDAPKRPDKLKVEIHSTVSKGVKWNVIVGLYDNKPYEVFALHHFTDIKEGELYKLKNGRYDLYVDDKVYSEDITSEMTGEEALITRICSTSLRHGSDITFLVEQLEKTSGDITSFGKALSRTLKRYARKERLIEKAKCENCGDNSNIVMEEGCLSCKSCGNAKCGG